MSEYFEKWLVEHESKSPLTAYHYAKAINRISKHYSAQKNQKIDLYNIGELPTLKAIASYYGSSGKYSDFGHNGNNTNRAAIKSLCRFLENSTHSTWKPLSFQSAQGEAYNFVDSNYGFNSPVNLRKAVLERLDNLFPEHHLYGKEEGIDFFIDGRQVDILLEHEDGDLLALGLKPGLATSEAFGELSIVLGLLLSKFPGRAVRGCIIAGEIDKSLESAVRTTDYILLKTYSVAIQLHHREPPRNESKGPNLFVNLFQSFF